RRHPADDPRRHVVLTTVPRPRCGVWRGARAAAGIGETQSRTGWRAWPASLLLGMILAGSPVLCQIGPSRPSNSAGLGWNVANWGGRSGGATARTVHPAVQLPVQFSGWFRGIGWAGGQFGRSRARREGFGL